MLRSVLLLTVLVLGSGCSEDEPEPDRTTVREGLADLFAGDHAGEPEQADGACFARELTDRVSDAELREAGVLDENGEVTDVPALPADLAEDWVGAQLACVDFVEASTRAQERATKGKLDDAAYAACLTESLPDERLRAALVATLTGSFDDPAVTELGQAQDTCARASTTAD